MEKRKIGNSGLTVAPLAFGGNVFGWTIDQATSFTLLDAFTEAGFNLIDTADVYSNWVPGNQGGESETIIGNWLKQSGKRDKVVIATKVGGEMSPGKKGLSKAHIRQSVEESLQRLQTDYIDLYQSHYDDPATPLEETLETYGELIKEGKIRAIGASNYSAERLAEALQVSKQNNLPRYDSLQPEYNLYSRANFEKELEPLCRENNIGIINYFSLASGFLTGKYRSEADLAKSKRGQGNKKYLNDRGFRILSVLDKLAKQYATDQARIAIAWLIARPSITAPIASATRPDQLQSLIQAANVPLDREAIDLLDKASAE
ncbi:alcohol dehydrogenase [Adhaeribacter arboris]|uniref:Alcohol dehydrogenase n=1 Tax=Adhaeribacter arboris TaxID=2072846 RepID=A0A2T2YFH7_9BACT|nr:aldo/keto reductase [Adhaeribacter arboris]PSR54243.1 alcohol dehydrogenase [Adhaeribacter arboris]